MPATNTLNGEESGLISSNSETQRIQNTTVPKFQHPSSDNKSYDEITEALICREDEHKTENNIPNTTIKSEETKGWSRIKTLSKVSKRIKDIKTQSNGGRKKNEDHLGVVFMGIILVFVGTFIKILDNH